MALDLITFRLEGILRDDIAAPNTWGSWRMDKNVAAYFRHGCLHKNHRKIRLLYRCAMEGRGQLVVQFNPTKLLYGEINSSNVPVSADRICTLLDEELKDVFTKEYFFRNRMPSILSSKSEIYVDICGPVQDMLDYYEFLKCMTIPGMYRDDKYAGRGTIYYHTAKTRGKSNKIYKVYLKHRELQQRGHDVDPEVGILRFEAVFRRRKLKRDFICYGQGMEYLSCMPKSSFKKSEDKIIPHSAMDPGSHDLSLLASSTYQISTLREFIEDGCHLDKRITTKENLLQVLGQKYSKQVFGKLVEVIEYLNGEREDNNMCHKTVNKYKKLILMAGYHYIYYHRELEPVDFKKSLCEHILSNDMESALYEIDMEEEDDFDLEYEEPFSVGNFLMKA